MLSEFFRTKFYEGISGSLRRSIPRGEHFGKGPIGYQRSDERIFEDVCETLLCHGGIDARHIEVKVEKGVVRLTGTVESEAMKRLTEEALDQIPGMRDFQNELSVDTNLPSQDR